MSDLFCPEGYKSVLDIHDTVVTIKHIKDYFESALAKHLKLVRVSAPLFVRADSGLNDNLNGTERPVAFDITCGGIDCEIIHSLAKWKRLALQKYGFAAGTGLYTDMNAIRRDEIPDNLHSVYVDQWDWEKIIHISERNENTLKTAAGDVYKAIKETEGMVYKYDNTFKPFLPDDISFVTTQELEDRFPSLTPHDRENIITKERGAVFLMKIGGVLKSGTAHDGRAPDYDDWNLNGDILVYYPLLDRAVELSSMGIRVDAETLRRQLEAAGAAERKDLPFHKALLAGQLPQTAGGGIGQSRLCLIFMQKAHIGEVQCSVWPEETHHFCNKHNIVLL